LPEVCINEMQTLAEGAMIGYTPRGMQLAQETIVIFCSFTVSVLLYRFDWLQNSKIFHQQYFSGEDDFKKFFLECQDGN
jgi:hypothetical protein